jgi:hypothetical protein
MVGFRRLGLRGSSQASFVKAGSVPGARRDGGPSPKTFPASKCMGFEPPKHFGDRFRTTTNAEKLSAFDFLKYS